MRFVFLSNYLTIHQLPFCQYLYKKFGEAFRFVATIPTKEERLLQGYSDLNSKYPFVVRAYENAEQEKEAIRLTTEADVVIFGGAPLSYVQPRLSAKKLTFLYSERLYKSGVPTLKLPLHRLRYQIKYGRYPNLHLLCASAYTAEDFSKVGLFSGKAYAWGYFPETRQYPDISELIAKKTPRNILWAGRFLDWKHPEYVVEVARRLKDEHYDFHITMLGSGELWDATVQYVKELGLEEQVFLPGAVPSEEVRSYMESASIYLFTSDRNEGWGAVLNEAMNSGCAVVAGSSIGSVPFLLEDGKNGMIFADGNIDDLYTKTKYLLDHPDICAATGSLAYEAITNVWNADIAAQRLLDLCNVLRSGEEAPSFYTSGPCSIVR